jgi:hypothetical protein
MLPVLVYGERSTTLRGVQSCRLRGSGLQLGGATLNSRGSAMDAVVEGSLCWRMTTTTTQVNTHPCLGPGVFSSQVTWPEKKTPDKVIAPLINLYSCIDSVHGYMVIDTQ